MTRSLALLMVPLLAGCVSADDAPHKFPATVLIIRHAEKPPDSENSIHLSDAGKKRAEALHKIFEKSEQRPDPFPKPDFLFAAELSEKSNRPAETIEPIAKLWKMKIDASTKTADHAKLAKHILEGQKYEGKVILISWRHSSIPSLATDFGVKNAPQWKDEVFDRVWKITWENGKAKLQDLPQQLMRGDSTSGK